MCNVVDLSALHDKKKTNGTAELLVLGPEWRVLQTHMCSNKYHNSSTFIYHMLVGSDFLLPFK